MSTICTAVVGVWDSIDDEEDTILVCAVMSTICTAIGLRDSIVVVVDEDTILGKLFTNWESYHDLSFTNTFFVC